MWSLSGFFDVRDSLVQWAYSHKYYTSPFCSVMFTMEHRRALDQEAERTGTHKTQTTSPSLTESWCMVIWEGTG